jgi:hypothetical protein
MSEDLRDVLRKLSSLPMEELRTVCAHAAARLLAKAREEHRSRGVPKSLLEPKEKTFKAIGSRFRSSLWCDGHQVGCDVGAELFLYVRTTTKEDEDQGG